LGGCGARHLLPAPMMNIVNGGATRRQLGRRPGIHGDAIWASRSSQRRVALPAVEIFHKLKEVLKAQ
jgi:enolase